MEHKKGTGSVEDSEIFEKAKTKDRKSKLKKDKKDKRDKRDRLSIGNITSSIASSFMQNKIQSTRVSM